MTEQKSLKVTAPGGQIKTHHIVGVIGALQAALRTTLTQLSKINGTSDLAWFDELEKILISDAKSAITEGLSEKDMAEATQFGIDVLQATLNAARHRFVIGDEK